MLLVRTRKVGAWACLTALPFLLCATTAPARFAASELSGDRPFSEVQSSLVRELAEQKLVAAGVSAEKATGLVDAVLAAGVAEVFLDSRRGSLEDPDRAWREAGVRYALALEERGIHVDPDAAEATASKGVSTSQKDSVKALSSGGKVVGFNWKALLIVALPILVVGAVLLTSGSGGGALLAVAAVVGLVLVLFVEPEWLFGAG